MNAAAAVARSVQSLSETVRSRLKGLNVGDGLEWAARIGYGARGFVFLSVGVLVLLAATDQIGSATGSTGAAGWLAGQPLGRLWLVLLGLGLWAFVTWRFIQSVFDADHEGRDWRGILARAGQGLSGVFYGLIGASVFEYLDEYGPRPEAEDIAENQEKAAQLLAMPFGQWLLLLAGLAILAMAVGNIVRAIRDDFTDTLACSERVCRRVAPLARIGYAARGFAYLPLAAFVVMAGLRESSEPVTSFGGALNALEAQPGGSIMLGLTAVGLIAFGAFAFVEARWRRIRPPKELA